MTERRILGIRIPRILPREYSVLGQPMDMTKAEEQRPSTPKTSGVIELQDLVMANSAGAVGTDSRKEPLYPDQIEK